MARSAISIMATQSAVPQMFAKPIISRTLTSKIIYLKVREIIK
jgi:hypothetical protein